MAKRPPKRDENIYLGDWLTFFDVGTTEAAKIAGCGQSYISNIARGRKSHINVLYLLRLSNHLGVTINDFYAPPPDQSHLDALKNLSPKAQATILARQRKE